MGVSVVELSRRFQVSKTNVSRIFLDMLEVLYVYLKSLINWPERPELQISMPQCFIEKNHSHYWLFWVIYWSAKKLNCTISNLVVLQTSPYCKVFDWHYTTRFKLFYFRRMGREIKWPAYHRKFKFLEKDKSWWQSYGR